MALYSGAASVAAGKFGTATELSVLTSKTNGEVWVWGSNAFSGLTTERRGKVKASLTILFRRICGAVRVTLAFMRS